MVNLIAAGGCIGLLYWMKDDTGKPWVYLQVLTWLVAVANAIVGVQTSMGG